MGRRKLELKPIQENSKRYTTFSKRRAGLNKKVEEFCDKFGAQAAVLVFSKAGNAFFNGYPNTDLIVQRYLSELSSSSSCDLNEDHDDKLVEAEGKIAAVIGNRPPAWASMMVGMEIEDLDRVTEVLKRVKLAVLAEVQSRVENLIDG